ncbi:MAG: DUF177 domain-containing protein [Proteobacteria bacterium]|nr:DUF177 domain-containing protein [Pseudomonadota bacterium]
MSTGLPAQIDPLRLAESATQLKGELPLKGMDRLLAGLEADGLVSINLVFEPEGRSRVDMQGWIEADVPVICQRCMGPMQLKVRTEVATHFAGPDAVLSEEQRPDTTIVEKPLQLRHLVEDELLLGLPMVPIHEPEACSASQFIGQQPQAVEQEEADGNAGEEKENPFAVLAGLKSGADKDKG